MRSPILFIILIVLMVDCLLEVGLIGSTVGYLHKDGIFHVVGPNNTVLQLLGKPLHLSVNQGHTSNGAAGTALILVGLLGLLILSSQTKLERSVSHGNSIHKVKKKKKKKFFYRASCVRIHWV